MARAVWYAASRVTSVRQGRLPVKPFPMRSRRRAMPSSVIRPPCPATSAMDPPGTPDASRPALARTEEAEDRLLEKAPLHCQRGWVGRIGIPRREPAHRVGIDEVREHEPEEPESEVRHLVGLPARAGRRLADDGDALAVQRLQRATDERAHAVRV